MNPDLELQIRKKYSEITPKINALELWVKNTFSELCMHEDLVYNFDIRIKSIESLIDKINKKVLPKYEKKQFPINVETIFYGDDGIGGCDGIEDFLGARIMSLVPGKLPNLHDRLLGMKRLETNLMTIHYPEDQRHRINHIKLDGKYELRSNINGYFGIHYIFTPKPVDEFYDDADNLLFHKFELQLRTMMQHAWSEVQHKVIYKSNRPDYNQPLDAQFSQLAFFISGCDDYLSKLTYTGEITPTRTVPVPESSKYHDFIDDAQKMIKKWEESEGTDDGREEDLRFFDEKYKTDIDTLLSSEATNDDNLTPKLELALLYLKGGEFTKAYEIYQGIKSFDTRNGWIWLRLAETCTKLLNNDEAIGCLTSLKEYIEISDQSDQESELFMGASMLSWNLSQLEYALFFGENAIKASKAAEHYGKIIRDNLNYTYYKLAWLELHQVDNFVEELEKLDVLVSLAIKLSENENIELTPEKCDTLLHFYSIFAEKESVTGHIDRARKLVEQAEIFHNQLFQKAPISKIFSKRELKQCWKDHSVKLMEIKADIGI